MDTDNFLSYEIPHLFTKSINVLETIIGCMYCGIIIAKIDNAFLLWNKRATEIIGKPQKDIPLNDWSEYYGVYETDKCENIMPSNQLPLARALNGEKVKDVELFIKNASNAGTYIKFSGSPLIENGEIKGAVVIFQDITEEKNNEEKIKIMLNQLKEIQLNTLKCFNLI